MDEAEFYGTGRRKNAVARVWLRPGQGTMQVNSRASEAYFVRRVYLQDIVQPLKATGTEGRFDVLAVAGAIAVFDGGGDCDECHRC